MPDCPIIDTELAILRTRSEHLTLEIQKLEMENARLKAALKAVGSRKSDK